jgi:hypothetical protein
MRSMELHFEVIRGRDAIHAELLQSKSAGYQLAICYHSGENLIVKICNVSDVVPGLDGLLVNLGPESNAAENVIPLDQIESIYPIHEFPK